MESTARIRAGVAGIVVGVIVLVIGLASTGVPSSTSSEGLGFVAFLGIAVLVVGVIVLVFGLRGRKQEKDRRVVPHVDEP